MNSNMMHAPGTWKIVGQDKTATCQLVSQYGCVIADLRFGYAENPQQDEMHASLIAAAPELLKELELAHQIIINALNSMTPKQKDKWDKLNERDGVKDGMAVTREYARRTVIEKTRKSNKTPVESK